MALIEKVDWRLLVLAYLFIAGVWGLLTKIASNRLDPPTTSFFAMTGAWLTVAIFAIPRLTIHSGTGIATALACGILGGILSIIFYSVMSQVNASVAIPLCSLYVIITALLSHFVLGESLSAKQLAGIAFGLLAVLLLTS
ncbi:MAG: EamA family transporter [Desulfobacteraceae bacterium]|nr:MAG: EamA family transporter [Desulfobacteraceae bacterium]